MILVKDFLRCYFFFPLPTHPYASLSSPSYSSPSPPQSLRSTPGALLPPLTLRRTPSATVRPLMPASSPSLPLWSTKRSSGTSLWRLLRLVAALLVRQGEGARNEERCEWGGGGIAMALRLTTTVPALASRAPFAPRSWCQPHHP